jgi:esterase/lipase superfamily enzyme
MSYYRREVGGWRSFNLDRDMGLTCIGKLGRPVLVFPDGGPAETFDSDGLGALQGLVDDGRFKLYVVDVLSRQREPRFDADDPASAIALQQAYDHYIVDEVLPFIQHDCRHGGIHIITLGFGAGAFHALNSACRHPHLFETAIALSGDYELDALARAAGTPESYFQNPPAFLPGLDDLTYLPLLRGRSVFFPRSESDELR